MTHTHHHIEFFNELDQAVDERLALSGHCAQTTFAVLVEAFGLNGRQILKALTVAPGVALRGETCGAALGGLLALGLVYGRDDLGDMITFLSALPPARRFCRAFEAANGAMSCAAIQEHHLGRPFDLARQQAFIDYLHSGGYEVCAGVVKEAVRLAAAELLVAEADEASAQDVWRTV